MSDDSAGAAAADPNAPALYGPGVTGESSSVGSNNSGVVAPGSADVKVGSSADTSAAYASADQGAPGQDNNVSVLTPGNFDVTLSGGNGRFVIDYSQPSPVDGSMSTGGNVVHIEGGNNQFVVKFAPGTSSGDATDAGGNSVILDGGNNQFVVAYDYSAFTSGTPSGNNVTVDGGNNAFVISYQGPNDGAAATSSAVNVGGDNNKFVVAYGGPAESGGDADAGGNPFASGGAAPSGAIAGGGNPFASSADGNSSGAASGAGISGGDSMSSTDMSSGGASSDLAASLRQSPFGALLDLPGVTPETIFGNINPDDYASLNSSGGGNPFGNVAPGSNPFTNYPGQTGLFSAATSGGASAGAPSDSNGGSNPFAGGSFGGAPADAGQSSDMSTNDATGAAGGVVAGAGDAGSIDFSSMSSEDAASFLEQSPFGPLITQAGVDANDLLANLSGGNNFSALIGLGGANNPFGDTASGGGSGGFPGSSEFAAGASAGSDYASATDITSDVYAQIEADGGSATDMMIPTT